MGGLLWSPENRRDERIDPDRRSILSLVACDDLVVGSLALAQLGQATARCFAFIFGDEVDRRELLQFPGGIAKHGLQGPVRLQHAVIFIGEQNAESRAFEHQTPALFARAQTGFARGNSRSRFFRVSTSPTRSSNDTFSLAAMSLKDFARAPSSSSLLSGARVLRSPRAIACVARAIWRRGAVTIDASPPPARARATGRPRTPWLCGYWQCASQPSRTLRALR